MPSKPQNARHDDPFDFAPAWRPDQDDAPVLEGEFTEIGEGFSEYGSYPIITIVDDNGESHAWHALTKIAQPQFAKALPKLGDRLKILYGGKKQGKNEGREPYTRWRVENLTRPVTADSLLDKYASETPVRSPSEFADEPPF